MCGETAAHESGYLCRLSRPLLSCSSSRLAIGCSCGHETNMIGSSCSRDVTRTLLQLLLRATFREKKIGSEGLLLPLATLTIALSFPSLPSSSRPPCALRSLLQLETRSQATAAVSSLLLPRMHERNLFAVAWDGLSGRCVDAAPLARLLRLSLNEDSCLPDGICFLSQIP